MSIICTQCGYENSDHYRFCGMCGAMLAAPKPAAVATPEPRTSRSEPVAASAGPSAPQSGREVSGPSFLGLSEQPSRGVEYLLEDEEAHDAGRRRMYAALLLLVIAGTVVMWRWRSSGLAWIAQVTAPKSRSAPSVQDNRSLTNGPPVSYGTPSAPAPSAPMASSSTPNTGSSTPPPAPSDDSHMVRPDESHPAAEATNGPIPAASSPDTSTTKPAQPSAKPAHAACNSSSR
jgi:hypothetical protein